MESVGEQVGGVKVEWADQTTHFDARHSYSETVNWGPCGNDGYDEAQECPAEYPHECSDASCRAANKSISVEKFAPSFNMGVRYWDKNMPFVALREFHRTLDLFALAGLPTTCINHSIRVIKQTMANTRREELELVNALSGKKKNNLPLNYRRMLESADKGLKRCKELAETLVHLASTRQAVARSERSSRECDFLFSARRPSVDVAPLPVEYDDGYNQAMTRLGGINRDLRDLKEIQRSYCTLTNEVKVLPCLLSRFTDDVSECEQWWTEIRSSDQIIW